MPFAARLISNALLPLALKQFCRRAFLRLYAMLYVIYYIVPWKIIYGLDSLVTNDMLTCDFAIQRTFDMQIGVVVQNHHQCKKGGLARKRSLSGYVLNRCCSLTRKM